MDLGMGEIYPRLSVWAQCNPNSPYKREVGGSESKKGHMIMEAEVGMTLKRWRKKPQSQGIWVASRSWKSKETGSPYRTL